MRLFIELKSIVVDSSSLTLRDVQASLVDTIANEWDWFPTLADDYDVLVNEMVSQLPPDDAELFLRTVGYGFRSKTLSSGLTASFVEERLPSEATILTARVRVFVTKQQEAQLAEIGLTLADQLLAALPQMTLSAMIIWKDRGRDSVLEGGVRERRSLREILGANAATAALGVVSLVLLSGLLALAVLESAGAYSLSVLGSDSEDWFKRLIGPLAATFAAALAAIMFDYRRSRVRRAHWRIGSRDEVTRPLY